MYSLLSDHYRFGEGEQYFVDGIAYCNEHDLATYTYCLRATRTAALQEQGRWDEALTMSMQLLDEGTTSPLNLINPHTRIGTIRGRRGQRDVWEPLDQALAAVAGTSQPKCIVPVRLARAEAFWLEGRHDEARREAELAADMAADVDPWARGSLSAWLRRTGSGRAVGDDVAEPYRLHRAGRHAEAVQLWDRLGCRYEAALTLFDMADEVALRAALDRFDALGATATADVTRRALRTLGVRSVPTGPRRATRTHPLGLTPRERQVLELICARRTNADIAKQLVISAKTVDHHVSAVLGKLDVHNRGMAAAEAARLGLVSTSAD